MSKTFPESLSDELVTNPGETTVNETDSMLGERGFLYHCVLLVDENCYEPQQRHCFHIYDEENGLQQDHFGRKVGNEVVA